MLIDMRRTKLKYPQNVSCFSVTENVQEQKQKEGERRSRRTKKEQNEKKEAEGQRRSRRRKKDKEGKEGERCSRRPSLLGLIDEISLLEFLF